MAIDVKPLNNGVWTPKPPGFESLPHVAISKIMEHLPVKTWGRFTMLEAASLHIRNTMIEVDGLHRGKGVASETDEEVVAHNPAFRWP